ncbi:hypothetical protein [Cognatiluteimonas profundi]|uniref:hypothetical protein n=1 Tax=Cognatiluteimonas profundi TaxID=2594501 RepID=UPI001E51DC02|nr:hypothetical protein [Lysobacter profundi]
MHSQLPFVMRRPGARQRLAGAIAAQGVVVAILIALHPGRALASGVEGAASTAHVAVAPHAGMQDLKQASASQEVQYVAQWVADSGDNAGMPYIIIDKVNAKVFVLDVHGRLQGTAPALLGMVPGDGTVAGIGDQKLSAIRPEERTTPAGRFVASLGPDLHGKDILWVDYANALALHRVVKGTPVERRAQRLASATADDNRISYGCINVPVKFYDTVVNPAFTHNSGVVYILPEMSPARDMFGPHEAATRVRESPQVR